MIIQKILAVLSTTLVLLLIALNYDPLGRLREYDQRMEDQAMNDSHRQGCIIRFVRFARSLILSSNVRFFIPFYGLVLHFAVCLSMAVFATLYSLKLLPIHLGVFFGMFGLILPFLGLQLLKQLMSLRVRRYAVDMLIHFKDAYITYGNIFEAFDNVVDKLMDPLKHYIEVFIFEHDHKIPAKECFNNLIGKIRNEDLQGYLINLEITDWNGGDVLALTDEFIDVFSNQNEAEDQHKMTRALMNMSLFALIGFDILLVRGALLSKFRMDIIGTFMGNVGVISNALSLYYVGYLILQQSAFGEEG